jgi:HSP20 family protein
VDYIYFSKIASAGMEVALVLGSSLNRRHEAGTHDTLEHIVPTTTWRFAMNTRTILAPVTNATDILRHEIDRAFDRLGTASLASTSPTTRFLDAIRPNPAVNMIEDDNFLFFEAELPGVASADLAVTVADNMLTISGCRTIETPEEARLLRRERSVKKFERIVRLPLGVDVNGIDAKLIDGVLTIALPKLEGSRTRRVAVREN